MGPLALGPKTRWWASHVDAAGGAAQEPTLANSGRITWGGLHEICRWQSEEGMLQVSQVRGEQMGAGMLHIALIKTLWSGGQIHSFGCFQLWVTTKPAKKKRAVLVAHELPVTACERGYMHSVKVPRCG